MRLVPGHIYVDHAAMLMCISSVEGVHEGTYKYVLFRWRVANEPPVLNTCHRSGTCFDRYTDITPTYDHGKAQQEGYEEAGP